MLDQIHLIVYPQIAVPAVIVAGLFWLLWITRRRRTEPSPLPDHRIKDAKDTIIMALLDDIAAQTAAVEATEAAAAAKIDDLTAKLAAANAQLAAAGEDVAAANALAARLKASNDALQGKVAA